MHSSVAMITLLTTSISRSGKASARRRFMSKDVADHPGVYVSSEVLLIVKVSSD
jgi:hypothetical protein